MKKKKILIGWTIPNLWMKNFSKRDEDCLIRTPDIATKKRYMGGIAVKVRITIEELP